MKVSMKLRVLGLMLMLGAMPQAQGAGVAASTAAAAAPAGTVSITVRPDAVINSAAPASITASTASVKKAAIEAFTGNLGTAINTFSDIQMCTLPYVGVDVTPKRLAFTGAIATAGVTYKAYQWTVPNWLKPWVKRAAVVGTVVAAGLGWRWYHNSRVTKTDLAGTEGRLRTDIANEGLAGRAHTTVVTNALGTRIDGVGLDAKNAAAAAAGAKTAADAAAAGVTTLNTTFSAHASATSTTLANHGSQIAGAAAAAAGAHAAAASAASGVATLNTTFNTHASATTATLERHGHGIAGATAAAAAAAAAAERNGAAFEDFRHQYGDNQANAKAWQESTDETLRGVAADNAHTRTAVSTIQGTLNWMGQAFASWATADARQKKKQFTLQYAQLMQQQRTIQLREEFLRIYKGVRGCSTPACTSTTSPFALPDLPAPPMLTAH